MGELTDAKIRALKPRERLYRVADGDGLSLEIAPNGSRRWRFRYRFGGKEQMLSLGTYPEVSLREARDRLTQERATLRNGSNPSRDRREGKQALLAAEDRTFTKVSDAWLARNKDGWAQATYRKAEYVVQHYLQKSLGNGDIATLGTPEARRAIAAVASRAPALAAKARGYLGSIIEYAIHEGLRDEGRLLLLKGAVPKRDKGHIAAATTLDDIRALLKAIDAYESPIVRAALTVTMLTAQRPGVVAGARWREINFEAGEWLVPPERMKMHHAHLSPLPTQAVATLTDMLRFTAGSEFIFPPLARQKSPHLHRDSLSNALRRMGFQGVHATHGFRAMFRTVARERLAVPSDVLEAQLAHAKKGEVAAAYDRTKFLSERREAMQRWADYLDALKKKR
jgi:integrase